MLTPHFRDFLPPWVARQPWYAGDGVSSLTPVGYFRFEDPAGERGAAPAQARGHPPLTEHLAAGPAHIAVRRLLTADGCGSPAPSGAAGFMSGLWHPGGPGTPAATGCLAVLRASGR